MEGIVRKKIRLLRSPKSKPLLNQLIDVLFAPNELRSQNYSLITCDLGDVESIKSKIEMILTPEERKFPTCLIFECVLGMFSAFSLNLFDSPMIKIHCSSFSLHGSYQI